MRSFEFKHYSGAKIDHSHAKINHSRVKIYHFRPEKIILMLKLNYGLRIRERKLFSYGESVCAVKQAIVCAGKEHA